MSRFYCDSRYGVSKDIQMAHAETVVGTQASAAALGPPYTVMENVTVTDWNVALTTGGTASDTSSLSFTIGKSLAGTGAYAAFGTLTVGTNADSTVVDGSATATNLLSGDDIIIKTVAGTAGAGFVCEAFNVKLKEHFIAD